MYRKGDWVKVNEVRGFVIDILPKGSIHQVKQYFGDVETVTLYGQTEMFRDTRFEKVIKLLEDV